MAGGSESGVSEHLPAGKWGTEGRACLPLASLVSYVSLPWSLLISSVGP